MARLDAIAQWLQREDDELLYTPQEVSMHGQEVSIPGALPLLLDESARTYVLWYASVVGWTEDNGREVTYGIESLPRDEWE